MNEQFNLNSNAIGQIQKNRNWFLFSGISLVALGTLAIIFSVASTLFSVMYLGIFLTILGIFEGISAFKNSAWSNFFLHLFLCILYIVAGIFITMNPMVNALSLTLLLALFFVVSGIARTIFAVSKNIPHRGWLALNGILTFFLGLLVWHQWPTSGLWVIGTFVGIDMLVTGWTWIMLSMAAKNVRSRIHENLENK